jgi:DNA-directed RNA polymerase
MLVRSAGRRQQRHTSRLLASSFSQLNLPWLAPAQLRWSASHTASSQPAPRPRRRSDSKISQQAKAQIRQLATSADSLTARNDHIYQPDAAKPLQRSPQDANIPWDFSKSAEKESVATLRPYSDPIIINNTTTKETAMIKVQNGVVGTAMDLLQHLYTTLRVGRMSRAEAIIQRLSESSHIDSPEVLHAHTAYLEELLRHLAAASSVERPSYQAKMQRWFEVEVFRKGVQPDAKMLVVMTRAAIRGLQGSRRDRTIRRYVEMANQLGELEYDEVLSSEDYDDNEFTILGAATSEFYEELEPDSEELASEEQNVPELDMTQFRRLDPLSQDELPEILAMEQKGQGLDTVKKSLEAFTQLPALPLDAPIEAQRARAYERQLIMEETSVDVAVERWRKEDDELKRIGISSALQTKPVGALMWQWYAALLPALAEELEACKKCLTQDKARAGSGDRGTYAPFMEILPIRKVAANTILYTMSTITRSSESSVEKSNHEVKLSSLITGLGKVIEQECAIDASKRSRSGKQRKDTPANRRNSIVKQLREQKVVQESGEPLAHGQSKLSLDTMAWPIDVKVKMGAMLVTKLIETAQLPVTREHPRTKEKITQLQPAFMHRMKYVQGKRVGMVVPNGALIRKIQSEPLGSLLAKRLPMIVEPRPWTSWNEGGYLQYPTPIVRLPIGDKSGKDYFLAADAKGDTKQVYAGLNALSKVPWNINHNILKVQIQAWNTGLEVGNFAPLNPTFKLPAEPEPSTDLEPRRKWLAEVREVENKKTGLHSQRCFQNFQLEIAKAVVNETLYFPHNLDFRGRAYPIPPYLNHMGADNARALLIFGDGKELGEAGLRWLKIHLANVAGYDKASLSEREAYTMEHLDDIYDSVRNPLDGRRWWLESEDAWQTLAACFELTSALDSPDPTKYISHLPTHQDGTCNGLQHYAALGGDTAGAAQVNLEPGDRPADIYSAVAKAVIEEVEKDAADGNEVAKMLRGKITRKVVKQPVMTNVYGVTFFGAKQQVKKQIEDILPDLGRYDDVNYSNISTYVTTKIFKSLGSMFTGAQQIQVWLGTCADRISTCLSPEQIAQLTLEVDSQADAKKKAKAPKVRKTTQAKLDKAAAGQLNAFTPSGIVSDDTKHANLAKPLFKSSVTWTTPLRMPVVQPYRSSSSRSVTTNLQRVTLQEPQVWDPVSKRKQLQAFPPNFIHSLDATHMMLSALKCNEVGLTFASIHDSFWTHACDIEKMSEVLRDAFVAMHSEDVIGRLHEEFRARYKDHMYLASVVGASEVGSKISALRKDMKSKSGQASELALEKQRIDLLASEDPAERAKGEAMVTPASIMAAESDESSYAAPAELSGQFLGDIPDDASILGENAPSEKDSLAATEGVAPADPSAAEDVVIAKTSGTVTQFTSKKAAEEYKKRKIYVWLPIAFPDVPAKGDFDVKRLKQSKYFFH